VDQKLNLLGQKAFIVILFILDLLGDITAVAGNQDETKKQQVA
jgi:hypothetical protein